MKAAVMQYETTIAKDGYECRLYDLKSRYRKQGRGLSLREFAVGLLESKDEHDRKAAETWLHNKKVNPKADLKGIGKTKKKKGGNGGKK